MEEKIIFFISAYLLFALFLTIHIFTTSFLAQGMAGVFGLSLILSLYDSFQDQIKSFFGSCKYKVDQWKKFFFFH